MADLLTLARLRSVLCYCPDTGRFTWRVAHCRGARVGKEAGAVSSNGYLQIHIDSHPYLAHRLAWFYMHGQWPKSGYIDHINGDKLDTRFSNLREATNGQNMQNQVRPHRNNQSGYLGVVPSRDRYAAQIRKNNKTYHLGVFDTPEEAHARYLHEKQRLHEYGTLSPEALAVPEKRKPKPSATGFTGVEHVARTGRYRAFYHHKRRKVHIGYFDTPEAASEAREQARTNARITSSVG